ncbi:MAG: septation protein SepH [Dermatophilaceae bacterium]
MQDLRLIGVHEDGMHLILGDDEGHRYRVELDEPLRAAARRDRARMGQLQIELEGVLRPRDVQAMIRAGLSAEEVADRAGWTVEKVHRYEGPILAEREHVAGLARQVRLRSRTAAHGSNLTLGARVTERLGSREIDAAGSRWDSRRVDKGRWTVLVYFNAGGRERQAAWDFDPLTHTVIATDDEARWLSEDDAETTAGPIPAPHLEPLTRPSRVYDVEAEGGVGAPRRRRSEETVDLMAAMRERSAHRGRRRRPKASEAPGLAHAPEDALPLEQLALTPAQVGPPPAAHLHPEDDPEATRIEPASAEVSIPEAPTPEATQDRPTPVSAPPAEREQPNPPGATSEAGEAGEDITPEPTPEPETLPEPSPEPSREPAATDSAVHDDRPAATEPTEAEPAATDAAVPDDRPAATPALPGIEPDTEPDHQPEADPDTPPDAQPAAKPAAARRSGRPSVPSWDDIMFGRKGD